MGKIIEGGFPSIPVESTASGDGGDISENEDTKSLTKANQVQAGLMGQISRHQGKPEIHGNSSQANSSGKIFEYKGPMPEGEDRYK